MIVRCLVCIPTFNNAESIISVIRDTLAFSQRPILVLDDGSKILVADLVAQEKDLAEVLGHRLTIHRFEQNQGKGAALQQAFRIALQRNFTHVITMDGDGQHKPSDLNLIQEEILLHPWALIIGKRKLTGEHVPSSSKFGRKFSNFWVKYQTDQTVEDSQSGFRSYPLFFIQSFKFFTTKYDFEIEVLIRLMWKKVEVREIEIDVYYPPPEERVSHFDKLWDNVKISLLNTVLVILSLLRSNISRKRIVASVALGVFVGVIPIYGFQMYLAALLAFVFRLNFPLMFLAQQISLPPMIPIWTLISLQIGSKLTNTSLYISVDYVMEAAQRLIPVWFLGSAVLGIILAVLASFLTLFLTKNQKANKRWTGKNRGGSFGNWFMYKVTDLLGPKVSYFFLLFICPYFYLFAPKAVYSHNQFFKITQPQLGFFQRQSAILKTFYKLGQVMVDNFYSNSKGPTYYNINRDGVENVFEALDKKKGLILVGAHVGAWMYASKVFATDERPGQAAPRVNIVEFHVGQGHNASNKIEDKKINYINNSEEAPIFKINQALTQNELLIFMADRPVAQNIELIPFFGRLAPIDVAAFKIALAKKAPISFSFGFKGQDKDYNLNITAPLIPEDFLVNGKNEATIAMAMKYTHALEHYLKMYPTQWFNFYPFWSALSAQSLSEHSKESKSYLV